MDGVGTTADEPAYQPGTGTTDPTTVPGSTHQDTSVWDEKYDGRGDYERHDLQQEVLATTRAAAGEFMLGIRDDSHWRQFPRWEPYELEVKTGPDSAAGTLMAQKVARGDGDSDYEDETQATVTNSAMLEIPHATVRQASLSPPPILQSEVGNEMVRMQDPHLGHQGSGSGIQHQKPRVQHVQSPYDALSIIPDVLPEGANWQIQQPVWDSLSVLQFRAQHPIHNHFSDFRARWYNHHILPPQAESDERPPSPISGTAPPRPDTPTPVPQALFRRIFS